MKIKNLVVNHESQPVKSNTEQQQQQQLYCLSL